MKKFLSLSILALLGAFWADAKVTLPSVFSDNMVFQRNSEAAIWGWTDSNGKISVTTTWTGAKYTATPDSNGKWMLRIPTPEAGGPYKVTIADGSEKIILSNVLVGEVWFCSGQSNMEMIMSGYPGQPTEGGVDEITNADPQVPIRICTITHNPSLTPLDQTKGSWKENTPEVVSNTSATAYFFAKKLHQALRIPIGILVSSVGGTAIECWMDKSTVSGKFPGEFDLGFLEGKDMPKELSTTPCVFFNGMVAPLIPFTFKGMIWYQGETNRFRPSQYTRLQKEYVEMMRRLFDNPDAPFYFAQLAPYYYSDPDGWTLGYFREAQQKSLDLIPRSGMAATVDVGEYGTIHPKKKREVGYRLAYLALSNDYGVKGLNPVSPTLKSVEFREGKAFIKTNTDGRQIGPIDVDLTGFEIAGADKVFHTATGRIIDWSGTVMVTSPEVPEPVAVRYCFRNWGEGTVFNNYGIPVSPFRTDDWDL